MLNRRQRIRLQSRHSFALRFVLGGSGPMCLSIRSLETGASEILKPLTFPIMAD